MNKFILSLFLIPALGSIYKGFNIKRNKIILEKRNDMVSVGVIIFSFIISLIKLDDFSFIKSSVSLESALVGAVITWFYFNKSYIVRFITKDQLISIMTQVLKSMNLNYVKTMGGIEILDMAYIVMDMQKDDIIFKIEHVKDKSMIKEFIINLKKYLKDIEIPENNINKKAKKYMIEGVVLIIVLLFI